MSDEFIPQTDPDQPVVYQIRIKGHLGPQWADWFEGLAVTREENGDTLLSGPVVDQAVLHGLLRKVRDLGMPLLSVSRVDVGDADASDETYQYRSKKENKNE
jgi:hypothetical protein